MGTIALLGAAIVGLTACTPPRSPAPDAATPAQAPADSMRLALNSSDAGQLLALRQVRWHLLRAQEARLCSLYTRAQGELDRSLHMLAVVEAENGIDSTARVLGVQVEDEYLRLLPQLERLSSDSPLILLLQGLSEERIQNLSPDATQLVRIHRVKQHCDMPVDANAKVAASVHFFQTRGRATMEAWMRRSGRFRDMILAILREQRLPEDLLYVAMIESGFNPRAYSRARAVGLWQFIEHTGRVEGLRRTHWVDERRDPLKSTRAAARHLRRLHDDLQDWRLAIAAYNAGRNRVISAMERANSRDFWELDLPRETENYVPLFMAATAINHDPELFGFDKPRPEAPLAYDEVVLPRDIPYIDLRVAADVLGTSYAAVQRLNPELRQCITPPGNSGTVYHLRVPAGKGARFLERYAQLPESAKPALYEYVVQPRDNLVTIARAFGVRSRLIAEANSISNPNRIYPGQRLFIPAGSGVHLTAAHQKVEHRVQAGESLSSIARRQGVRVRDLIAWNGLASTVIHPGDRLTVWRRGAQRTIQPSREATKAPTDGTLHHTVSSGETLWELSRLFGVSVTQLQRWNDLSDSLIRPGEELVVGPEGQDREKETYTVVKGDTLYRIARRFGLRARDLARHNNMSVSSTLLAGTTLRLAPARNRN